MLLFNTMDPDPRVWKEAESLARNGTTVRIYALRGPGQEAVSRVDGFEVRRFSRFAPTNLNPPKTALGLLSTAKALLMEPFDVYHCHDAATLPFGYLLARKSRSLLIYDSHEYEPDRFNPVALRSMKRRLLARLSVGRLTEPPLIRRASKVITVNGSIARLLAEHYRLKARPTVVRNIPKYRERATEGSLRDMLSLEDGTKILLYLGVSVPGRGVTRCVDLLEYLPDAVLVLAGRISDEYRSALLRRASETGAEDRLHILGHVPYEQVHTLASQADVGLFLAKPRPISTKSKYSLPNKIFEYLMARLPMVVMDDRPEIADLVHTYQIGAAVDPDDTGQLVSTVKGFLYDEELSTRVREACEAAARVLSWEHEEQALLGAYDQLLRNPTDRRVAAPSQRTNGG